MGITYSSPTRAALVADMANGPGSRAQCFGSPRYGYKGLSIGRCGDGPWRRWGAAKLVAIAISGSEPETEFFHAGAAMLSPSRIPTTAKRLAYREGSWPNTADLTPPVEPTQHVFREEARIEPRSRVATCQTAKLGLEQGSRKSPCFFQQQCLGTSCLPPLQMIADKEDDADAVHRPRERVGCKHP